MFLTEIDGEIDVFAGDCFLFQEIPLYRRLITVVRSFAW
jgi:hypothetical protein